MSTMPNRHRSVWKWILAFATVPVLYVLSFGPLLLLALNLNGRWHTDAFTSAHQHMYEPLYVVTDRSELADRALEWYTGLWIPELR